MAITIGPVLLPRLSDRLLDTTDGYGAGAKIWLERSADGATSWTAVTSEVIVSGVESIYFRDSAGTATSYYRTYLTKSDASQQSAYSDVFQVGSQTAYASLDEFKLYVRDSAAATVDDGLMVLALDAASRAVDRSCSRTFKLATGVATARQFEPVTGQRFGAWYTVLRIDDTFDATPVVKADDGTGTYSGSALTGVRLLPLNAPSLGLPYTELVLTAGAASVWPFEVTAEWGWDAVPSSVTYATMLQASRFIKRRDSPFGVAGSPDLGSELQLLARLDPDVAVLLSEFQVWGAVA